MIIITKTLFKITFKNTLHKQFFELFPKPHFVCVLIETRIITKTRFQNTFKTTPQSIFSNKNK